MCHVMRDADHAGRSPASTSSCDITARRRASAMRAGWKLYSCTAQAYCLKCASQTNVACRRQVVVHARHLARQLKFCRGAAAWIVVEIARAHVRRRFDPGSACTPCVRTGERVSHSRERVKNLLHIVILLELVDDRQ